MDANLTVALVRTEQKFGGLHTDVPRNKVSPFDPRHPIRIANGGMTGGDRMGLHGYAVGYAENLPRDPKVIVELGVLRGVGLAIWCDLFPGARVIGLDVDTGHFFENNQRLLELGAFATNSPEVYEYDELVPEPAPHILRILNGQSIDVMIDDALHYDDAIIKALLDFMPFVASGGVYFVEDNDKVHRQIRSLFPKLRVTSLGRLTVIKC